MPQAPPVARTTRSAGWSRPPSVRTPRTRPPSTSRDRARSSTHVTRRSSWTDARRARRIAHPVASPPACSTRRALWPPSRVGAPPSSNTIPLRRSSSMAAGASAVRTLTASGSLSPAPAAIVSAAWASGSSPSDTAAAMPPWASAVALPERGSGAIRVTGPRWAAWSAHHRPAAPAPTTAVFTKRRFFRRP